MGCSLRSGWRVAPPGSESGALDARALGGAGAWPGAPAGAALGSSMGTEVYSLLAMGGVRERPVGGGGGGRRGQARRWWRGAAEQAGWGAGGGDRLARVGLGLGVPAGGVCLRASRPRPTWQARQSPTLSSGAQHGRSVGTLGKLGARGRGCGRLQALTRCRARFPTRSPRVPRPPARRKKLHTAAAQASVPKERDFRPVRCNRGAPPLLATRVALLACSLARSSARSPARSPPSNAPPALGRVLLLS